MVRKRDKLVMRSAFFLSAALLASFDYARGEEVFTSGEVAFGYQTLSVLGGQAKFYQYDVLPEGIFPSSLSLAVERGGRSLFRAEVSRWWEGTYAARGSLGQTAEGRVLRWEATRRRFYLNLAGGESVRRVEGVSLRLPAGEGLNLGYRVQGVRGDNGREGIDVRARDVYASQSLSLPAADFHFLYARRALDDRTGSLRQGSSSAVSAQLARGGRASAGHLTARYSLVDTDIDSQAGALQQGSRTSVFNLSGGGMLAEELNFAARYGLQTVSRSINGLQGPAAALRYARRTSTAALNLTYTGLPRTTLRGGVRFAEIEHVNGQGLKETPARRSLWLEGRSRPSPRVTLSAKYKDEVIQDLPASGLDDPSPLLPSHITSGVVKAQARPNQYLNWSLQISSVRKDNPCRGIVTGIGEGNLSLSWSGLSNLPLFANWTRQVFSSNGGVLQDYESRSNIYSLASSRSTGAGESLDISLYQARTKGGGDVRENALSLSFNKRVGADRSLGAEFRVEDYDDNLVCENSFLAKVVNLNWTSSF